ncbi:MAG: hypothetical protein JW966_04085 [Anaerolineae bacterium]|nr:hypothetical protein [Anaerolineae bacterium]
MMKHKRLFTGVLIVLVLLALIPAPVGLIQAQGPDELTNTYTTLDGWSINYPDGWSISEMKEDDISLIRLDSTADLAALDFGAILFEGDVQIMIVFGPAATLYGQVGAAASATPIQVLSSVIASSSYTWNTSNEVTMDGLPGAYGDGAAADGSFDLMAFITRVNDTAILMQFNVVPGGLETFAPTAEAIAKSLIASMAAAPAEPDIPAEPAAPALPAAQEIRQWAVAASASSEYSNPDWAAIQAAGAPDTFECADAVTAWASRYGSGKEWLRLDYATPVIPTQVNIHQTLTPGSIIRVEVGTPDGQVYALPDSADPVGNTVCPGVFAVIITDALPAVNSVTIYLDESFSGYWNEIDAVELVGKSAGAAVPDEPVAPVVPGNMSDEALPEPVACDITTGTTVNLRIRPGAGNPQAGQIGAGSVVHASGQTAGIDGYTWWRLTNGAWVRDDVITAAPDCAALPLVDPESPLPLTERYTNEDGYSVRIPQEWTVIESDGEVILGNSPDVANRPFGDPLSPGEFQLSMQWGPADMMVDTVGLSANPTPMEILNAAAVQAEGMNLGEPYELAVGDQVAAAIYGTFADMDVEIGVIIVQLDDGLYYSLLTLSDLNGLEQFEPTVRAIATGAAAESLPVETEPAAPVVVRPEPETPEPTIAAPAAAPAGDLPQAFTFDAEHFSISIPDGWQAEDKIGYVLIKNDPFSAAILGMKPGQVEISIDQSFTTDAPPAEHVITFITPMADSQEFTLSEPVELTVAGAAAARVDTSTDGYHLMALAIARGDGAYFEVHAYTHPDEFAQYEATILAILDTIVYTP